MFGNWLRQTTTTTGTGSITLDAVTGFPTFNDIFGTTAYFSYTILSDSDGTPIETGIGHMSSSTVMVRDKILATFVSSVYDDTAPSAVTLASGTKRVICAPTSGLLTPNPAAIISAAGQKMVFPTGMTLTTNTKTLTANTAYLSCLKWEYAAEINSLACQVTTLAGTGSDRIQLGIYGVSETGVPGNLICRTGDIAPNTTGLKTAALSSGTNKVLQPGWYWFCIGSNVGPVVTAYNGGGPGVAVTANNSPMGRLSGTSWNIGYAWWTATLSGGWTALPSTVTLVSGVSVNADFAPTVGVLVA